VKLYAAHPVSCYGTEHEARQLAALDRHFPGADLADPAAMFGSDDGWLEGWPDVLDELDVLAIFADEAGYIGATLLEVSDAIGAGVPIVALDQNGQLRHFGGSSRESGLVVPRQRVGRLLYGPPLPSWGSWQRRASTAAPRPRAMLGAYEHHHLP
jgi:hypothetical protein